MSANQLDTREQVGRTWQRDEILSPAPLEALAATFDRSGQAWPGSELPPLAHWLYFLPQTQQSKLGADGHPSDEFVPPAALPRRMWAGGKVEFIAPLCVGTRVTRTTTVTVVEPKVGRTGPLMLVTLRHELATSAGLAIREYRNMVYRAPAGGQLPEASPDAALQPPPAGTHRRVIRPDPVLLFRFSALTFNAHRIHYDREYCRQVEGYPGLVVQGPLVAMLLINQALSVAADAAIESFQYRNHAPLFDGAEFTIDASRKDVVASVVALDFRGQKAASGTAVLRAVPSRDEPR